MKKFLATIIVLLTICITSAIAQSSADVQSAPVSRDAVISPPATTKQADTDSAGVNIDNQRDTQLPAQSSTDTPAGNSGQPVPSVRKPD